MRNLLFCLATAAVFLMTTSCTEEPKPKKEEKPAEPVTALKAFYAVYSNARTWATDLQVLDIKSIDLDDTHRCKEGKCWAWSVTLISPAKRQMKMFTYSVIESEGNLHKGVFGNLEDAWRGTRGQDKPFIMQALKKDSTDAYQAAAAKSAAYIKKNPDMPRQPALNPAAISEQCPNQLRGDSNRASTPVDHRATSNFRILGLIQSQLE